MLKAVSGLLVVGLCLVTVSVQAGSTGDKYFLVGYSQSRAQATTTYGPNTQFDTSATNTVGFSTSLYDDYSIGLIADFNQDLQEIDNFSLLFGIKNSRFKIQKSSVSGTLNGKVFDYTETSYIWYVQPENSWEKAWGLSYGNYKTLGQSESYNPPTGSDFLPVEVTYLGYVVVGDVFETNKKGWGADGQTGFMLMQFSPDASSGLDDSSSIGILVNIRMGYFLKFGGYRHQENKAGLFMGAHMSMTMDFLSEYTLPFSLGPSVQFTTRW